MISTSKLYAAQARDKSRFQSNPLGDGYLNRFERWQEAIAYAKKREAESAKQLTCDLCNRRGDDVHTVIAYGLETSVCADCFQ